MNSLVFYQVHKIWGYNEKHAHILLLQPCFDGGEKSVFLIHGYSTHKQFLKFDAEI